MVGGVVLEYSMLVFGSDAIYATFENILEKFSTITISLSR